ncbi:hypothetical protein SUNI508_09212 [Seiridium unicorne]|uniref:Beta-lactamase-related domain-containing protein n=1 Tax=Seiridium unicorne TaxID=138068 RepID=A0ABR2UQP7_9PEZI
MPWEGDIPNARSDARTSHIVDVYAKGGGAYGYQSHIAAIDEYGVAVMVLTAVSPKAVNIIYVTALSTLVPAIDKIARDQAIKYTSTFVGHSAKNNTFNATVTQDRDTLVLTGLVRDGTHILASVREILLEQLFSFQTSFLRKPDCIM